MDNYKISKRENRKQFKNQQEKLLRKLYYEERKLWNAKRSLGFIELEKPIRKGYKKILVLRDDITRSPIASTREKLIKLLKMEIHHHDKRFMKKARKNSKKLVPITMLPLYIDRYKLAKLPPEFQSYFIYDPSQRSREYKFSDSWIFRERIVPHYITHVRIHDAELESRIKQLENYIDNRDIRGKMNRLYYGHHQYKLYWHEMTGRKKEIFVLIQKEMNEYYEMKNAAF